MERVVRRAGAEVVELGVLDARARDALVSALGCSFTDEDRARPGAGTSGWLGHVAVDAGGRARLVVFDDGGRTDLARVARAAVGRRRWAVADRVRRALTGP